MGVLLRGADESRLTAPRELADYLLRRAGTSLLKRAPVGPSRAQKITAKLYRDRCGAPVIQTYLSLGVGPQECAASIALLWAWAVLQAGDAGMAPLWYAMSLVPYYHQEHAAEHGYYWEFRGYAASCSYIINMLATAQALSAAQEGNAMTP